VFLQSALRGLSFLLEQKKALSPSVGHHGAREKEALEMNRMIQHRRQTAVIFLLIGILSACAGNYGKFMRDRTLEQAFQEKRPPENYHYYANGRENIPDAIIGIDPAFTLMSKFWRKLDFESGQVAELAGKLFPYRLDPPTAYTMLTPDGRVIGVYYSALNWPTVKIGDDNQVWVYPSIEPTSGQSGGGAVFFGSAGAVAGVGF
jgi:hypothetical protein